jgi:hypothetical protein
MNVEDLMATAIQQELLVPQFLNAEEKKCTCTIMFTPARDFLLETPWRIIIPNPNVNSHYL